MATFHNFPLNYGDDGLWLILGLSLDGFTQTMNNELWLLGQSNWDLNWKVGMNSQSKLILMSIGIDWKWLRLKLNMNSILSKGVAPSKSQPAQGARLVKKRGPQ